MKTILLLVLKLSAKAWLKYEPFWKSNLISFIVTCKENKNVPIIAHDGIASRLVMTWWWEKVRCSLLNSFIALTAFLVICFTILLLYFCFFWLSVFLGLYRRGQHYSPSEREKHLQIQREVKVRICFVYNVCLAAWWLYHETFKSI